jgi:hypothetical protein
MEGYLPEHDIDHINRIKDDNSWNNLRHVSRSCNIRNCPMSSRNKSGITGVYKKKIHKWYTYITFEGKREYLGIFENKRDAAQARWEAEVKYGFPNCNTTSSAFQFLQSEVTE